MDYHGISVFGKYRRRRTTGKKVLDIIDREIEFVLAYGDQLGELGFEVVYLVFVALHLDLVTLARDFQAGIISTKLVQDPVSGPQDAHGVGRVEGDSFLHSIPVIALTLSKVDTILS